MQAVLLTAPRRAGMVELADPIPDRAEALVRVEATGLCGSDISTWLGHHPFRRPPVVLGHEAAGVVEAVNDAKDSALIGRRVALCPLIPCGKCTPCRRGATNLCASRRVPGVGWGGTYAGYVTAPTSLLYPVGIHVSAPQAAMIEPTAVALRAIRRAGVTAGSRVAILGAGGIGSLCTKVAVASGATTVLVSDVQPAKLARLAESIPCHTALAGPAQRAAVAGLVGDEGFDSVLVTAAAPGLLDDAVAVARPGGTVVIVALHGVEVTLDIDAAVVREIDVRGSYVYDARDFADACELVSKAMVPVDDLITHALPLADAPATFERIAAGLDYTKIVFLP